MSEAVELTGESLAQFRFLLGQGMTPEAAMVTIRDFPAGQPVAPSAPPTPEELSLARQRTFIERGRAALDAERRALAESPDGPIGLKPQK